MDYVYIYVYTYIIFNKDERIHHNEMHNILIHALGGKKRELDRYNNTHARTQTHLPILRGLEEGIQLLRIDILDESYLGKYFFDLK